MAKEKKDQKRKLWHVENFVKGCINFPEKCESCRFILLCLDTKLKYYSNVPWFIIDNYMQWLSPSAFKVYLFLFRSVNFSPYHNDYGKCYLTYKQISKGTGVAVSNMGLYMKELIDEDLIAVEQKQVRDKVTKRWVTLNTFWVSWYFHIEQVKKIGDKLRP